MRGLSLRLRLTLITAGLLLVALAAGAITLTGVLAASRIAALDAIVVQRAGAIGALVEAGRIPQVLPVGEPGEIAQVVDAGGRVAASSANASRTLPALPAEDAARLAGAGEPGVGTSENSPYGLRVRAAVLEVRLDGQPARVVVTVPLTEVEGLLHALRLGLLGVVPALTALIGAAIWFALGRALLPVDALRQGAAAVAASGGPGSLPVPPGDDEIAALARTLNGMLDRLREASERQRAFVADAAHELRSPIAALRASVDVAAAHPQAWDTAGLAADLAPEVLRMQALVDDLLLLARVGSTARSRERLDLAAVARDAVASSRGQWPAGVTVESHGAGAAWGNVAAITRAVRNLVDNAARHASGCVVVTVTEGRIDVDDDGPGIPAADRERVFERFVRLGSARERPAGGSGLGLAIAREMARQDGGEAVLSGSTLGGLRATVTLPLGPADGTGPGSEDQEAG